MGLIKSIVGLLNRRIHEDIAPKVIDRKGVVVKLKNTVKDQLEKARNRNERRARGHRGGRNHWLRYKHFGTLSPLRPVRGLKPDRFGRLCLSEKWRRAKP